MNSLTTSWARRLLIISGALTLCGSALAFPPAPNHIIYGIVRDEMGQPLVVTNAQVILETLTGTQLKTLVIPQLGPGLNYRLTVPMDAGLTADAYKPTALQPTVAFRLKVRIGAVSYLPIELRGDYASLGQPAQSTQLDLTLGEDSDGDGLPDAWERALMTMLDGNRSLQDIRLQDDSDGDGLSNYDEYIAGTYAFDSEDGFKLSVVGTKANGRPVIEFLAIPGRTYSLSASSDTVNWVPISFRFADDESTREQTSFLAKDVRRLRLEAIPPAGQPTAFFFFKAMVK